MVGHCSKLGDAKEGDAPKGTLHPSMPNSVLSLHPMASQAMSPSSKD